MREKLTLARVAARFLRAAACAAISASLCVGMAAAEETKPRRVVSVDLCTDQLALLIAPERVVSVSFLAADPASSAMAERVKGVRLNRGRVEEILPLAPDIVLAGPYGARAAVALLNRLGRRVWQLPLGQSLDDVPRHIRAVARVLGEDARGEALVREFESRLAAIPDPPPGPRPVAALYGPGGITSGAGTLPHAVMTAAGFDNLAAWRGIGGVGHVHMETIVLARPDVVILGNLRGDPPSLARDSLDHPALVGHRASTTVVSLPHHLWSCAIPAITQAVEILARIRGGRRTGTSP